MVIECASGVRHPVCMIISPCTTGSQCVMFSGGQKGCPFFHLLTPISLHTISLRSGGM